MAYETASRIISGRKAVGVPGVAEKLVATNTGCYRIDLSADIANTSPIVIGGSGVVAAADAQKGVVLTPGNPPLTILARDVSSVYVDVITADDAVVFNYYQT